MFFVNLSFLIMGRLQFYLIQTLKTIHFKSHKSYCLIASLFFPLTSLIITKIREGNKRNSLLSPDSYNTAVSIWHKQTKQSRPIYYFSSTILKCYWREKNRLELSHRLKFG